MMAFKKLFKKIAGAVSPAYGMATGEGAMGKASRKGLFGALPRAVTKAVQRSEQEKAAPSTKAAEAPSTKAAEAPSTKAAAPAQPASRRRLFSRAEGVSPSAAARRAVAGAAMSKEGPSMGFEKFSSSGGGSAMSRAAAEMAKKKASATATKMYKGGEVKSKKSAASGGMVKARGMGAATRGGKCKVS